MYLLQALSGHGRLLDRFARPLIRRRLTKTVNELEDQIERARSESADTGSGHPAVADLASHLQPLVFAAESIDRGLAAQLFGPLGLGCCGFWLKKKNTLEHSEDQMLRRVSQRAEIEDGMSIINVSPHPTRITSWFETRFPNCSVAETSPAAELDKATAIGPADRVLVLDAPLDGRPCSSTAESLSHLIGPGGKILLQRLCHRRCSHAVISAVAPRSGRIMPSAEKITTTAEDLALRGQWELSGEHYAKTAQAWLTNLDRYRAGGIAADSQSTSPPAQHLLRKVRLDLLATSRMFGLFRGQEWWVAQSLFENPAGRARDERDPS